MIRTGSTDLPLHGGKAPPWLFQRMVKLGGAISEAVILEYGRKEFLDRLTDPYWFQSLACVIGFDWHSSGTTTTTCGALKEAMDPAKTGIAFLGGKGAASRKIPDEMITLSDTFSLNDSDLNRMLYASRMSAKVDNSLVQDGHHLYHHSFIITEDGDWGVIQQGMATKRKMARRYHWRSDTFSEFVSEPHKGICCNSKVDQTLDMTAWVSKETRETCVDLVKDDPRHIKRFFSHRGQLRLDGFHEDHLSMPDHHFIIDTDISDTGWKQLQKAYEIQPDNYEELVSIRGIGPKKIRALALVSELIYGTRPSWEDPVKFSFAHGGKDGTPFPVDRDTYDSTIRMLRDTLEMVDLGDKERLGALNRLQGLVDIT